MPLTTGKRRLFPLLLTFLLVSCASVENASTGSGRRTDHDLIQIARREGFELLPVSLREESLIARLFPTEDGRLLRSVALLRDSDRIAAAFWYRHPDVGRHMERITKEAFRLLSENATDIRDDTVRRSGFVPIDVLAFTDPRLSKERILFARMRDNLYEFHVAEGAEGLVEGLLTSLARE